MADLDALLDEAATDTFRCKYARIVADLTPEQRDKLEKLSNSAAAEVLTRAGMPVSNDVIRRHRRGHRCG